MRRRTRPRGPAEGAPAAINRLRPRPVFAAIAVLSAPPPNNSIRELEAVLGGEATRDLVRLFLAEFPVSVRGLESGGRRDRMMVAHGLKSSALHMGAATLSGRMAALESRLDTPGGTVTEEDIAGALADFEGIAPGLRLYAGA